MISSITLIYSNHATNFLHTLLSIPFVFYILLLLYLTIAQPSSICTLLQAVDPSHTCQPPLEKSHTTDCNLAFTSVISVLDQFVLAHLFGWLVKALLIPYRPILYTASIIFELLEWALIDTLPTFKECWWDSWILDVLVCNLIGIECALSVTRCSYSYTLRDPCKTQIYSFASCTLMVFAILLTDLNAFLLKHVLYIHSASPLNLYRLGFYIILSIPVLSQLHKPRPSNSPLLFSMLYLLPLFLEFLPIFTDPLHIKF